MTKRVPTPRATTNRIPGGRGTRRLLWVLLLAFGLRLATVLWLSDTVPYSDFAYYDLAARKITTDWGFFFDASHVEEYGKFGWWPPLYPFSIAALYSVFGTNHRFQAFLQVLLGTATCWLVFRIGKRSIPATAAGGRTALGERLGLTAALLTAIDPTYVFATNLLASENLFVFLLALGLFFALSPLQNKRRLGATGFFLGLATLTRAIGLMVPLVAAAWLRSLIPGRRAWLIGAASMLGVCAMTILPWTIRNAVVAGSPALVCFGGGLNFYFGHNDVRAGYRDISETPMRNAATQAAIDRMGYDLGWNHLAAHPITFFTGAAEKVARLFGSPAYAPHTNSAIMLPDGWQTDPARGQIAAEMRERQRRKNQYLDGLFTRLAAIHSYILMAGSIAALFYWRRLPAALRLCVYLSVSWIAAHVLFWAQPRFRYPMELFMLLLTAFVWTHWTERRQSAEKRRVSAAAR